MKRLEEMFKSGVNFHSKSRSSNKYFEKNVGGCHKPHFFMQHFSGPESAAVSIAKQFKRAEVKSMKLSTESPNNCCLLLDGEEKEIVAIKNFFISNDGEYYMMCQTFSSKSDFYTAPCPSSDLNIFSVSNLQEEIKLRKVSEITKKMIFLSREGKSVVLPLLHF